MAGRGNAAMAAPVDRPGDSSSERPTPETSKRRLRDQGQLDFEIEFLGRLLERDPFFVDALRAQASNLAAKGQYARALQLDRRLVRLTPEHAIAWYNLACTYTVLGMIDPGFFALQRALELGYDHTGRLLRDPDLKALRRDPRFDRLLRRFGFRG
jgi:tetratricopeptide (TPR) repeat protein